MSSKARCGYSLLYTFLFYRMYGYSLVLRMSYIPRVNLFWGNRLSCWIYMWEGIVDTLYTYGCVLALHFRSL